MRLIARHDNVVLKVLKREMRKGSIVLPDSQGDEADWCEVVDVGPDIESDLAVGQLVLRPTGLYEWHDDETDETYIVAGDEDVVATFEEDEDAVQEEAEGAEG